MLLPDFLTTSGNLIADKRYEYALDLMEQGDFQAAKDLLLQTQELIPNWPVIPFQLGVLSQEQQEYESAISYFKQTLVLDPDDHQGAALKIQQCQNFETPPEALPEAFVKSLFDQYAPRFDEHLLQTLSYNVPKTLFELIQRHKKHDKSTRILDLGCGTGLAAEFFIKEAQWMVGVDISAGMLAQAEQKQIYNELVEQDLLAYLSLQPSKTYDLVLAADVLTYFGDLEPLILGIPKLLDKTGLFAFSVQKITDKNIEDLPFHLEETNRFIHNAPYIDKVLDQAGLEIIVKEDHVIRQDRGNDVNGLLYLCSLKQALDSLSLVTITNIIDEAKA